jgi:hypothetical protein
VDCSGLLSPWGPPERPPPPTPHPRPPYAPPQVSHRHTHCALQVQTSCPPWWPAWPLGPSRKTPTARPRTPTSPRQHTPNHTLLFLQVQKQTSRPTSETRTPPPPSPHHGPTKHAGAEADLPPALVACLAPKALQEDPGRAPAWRQWLGAWRAALRAEGVSCEERQRRQKAVSPKYVPRQHLLQVRVL